MIRDYFRYPQRQGARSQHDPNEQSRHGSGRQSSRGNSDWERWPDPEALRWSPRSARQERERTSSQTQGSDYDEDYGYGSSYLDEDQRPDQARFQQDWEGNYRSTPWRLGAEVISPGMHGPYGPGQDSWLYGEDYRGLSEERDYPRYDPYRGKSQPQQRGLHRGVGPQNYVRADERIRDDVCDRLTDHPEVDARYLEVTVENGVVLLQGTVTDRAMKYGAEDCSWHVNGVKDVDNRIRVDRAQETRQRKEGSGGGGLI
jgi:hypothetical protein